MPAAVFIEHHDEVLRFDRIQGPESPGGIEEDHVGSLAPDEHVPQFVSPCHKAPHHRFIGPVCHSFCIIIIDHMDKDLVKAHDVRGLELIGQVPLSVLIGLPVSAGPPDEPICLCDEGIRVLEYNLLEIAFQPFMVERRPEKTFIRRIEVTPVSFLITLVGIDRIFPPVLQVPGRQLMMDRNYYLV